MRSSEVVIIGAGAAGLMCALTAAQRGRQVLLIDHANKAGKKILMSGGGRCNFTNMYAEPANFAATKPALLQVGPRPLHAVGLHRARRQARRAYHEKKLGQLFCDNRSKDILNMLLEECRQAGVDLRLQTAVQRIDRRGRLRAAERHWGRSPRRRW